MQKDTQKDPMIQKRIIVFGRTGAGKSTLGNRLFCSSVFQEGHTLQSETLQCQEKKLEWSDSNNRRYEIFWVDTPGFADNRPNISNQVILKNITDLLNTLKKGFDVVFFCLPAKTRVAVDEIEEIKMIGKLLGDEVYKHMNIIITQLDTFNQEARKRFEEIIPRELPEMLKPHEISIRPDQIIMSNFLDFQEKFLKSFETILLDSSTYPSKNVIPYSDNDKSFFQSEGMLEILAAYLSSFKQIEDKLNDEIDELKNEDDDGLRDEIEEKQKELYQIRRKIKDFNQTVAQNDKDSKLIRLLRQKKLLEPPLDPIYITTVKDGIKYREPVKHKLEDHIETTEELNTFAWRIMVPASCPGFEYSFRKCTHTKNCLILVVRQKYANSPGSSFIPLGNLCKRNSKDRVLYCEINTETFKVSNENHHCVNKDCQSCFHSINL